LFNKLVDACSSPVNEKARTFLVKAGFMEYMTNRWRKNFGGQITIFCTLDTYIEFSANYNILSEDGVKKQGSIPPERMSAQNYEEGLKRIVDKVHKEVS